MAQEGAVVPRVREAMHLAAGDPFVVLYGAGASDTFVDMRYRERQLEDVLAHELRTAGYRHIVFTSASQPWYCLDESSRDFFARKLRNAERARRGTPGARSDVSGQIPKRPTGSFREVTPADAPGDGAQRQLSAAYPVAMDGQQGDHNFDIEAVKLLKACLKVRDTPIAIVVVRAEQFLSFNTAERDLADWLARWQQTPTAVDNVCVLVFTERSLDTTAEFVKSLRYAGVLVSCLERQRLRSARPGSGEIRGPDPAELERVVHQVRLTRGPLMRDLREWRELDRNLTALAAQPGVTANRWGRYLRKLADSGRGLTERELRRDGWVDASASAKSAWERLNELTGLGEVKAHIDRLRWLAEAEARRRKQGLMRESGSLHLVFSGGPGTGKTTVARLIGELYHEMGLLRRGHLYAPEASELIGMYVGHTAVQTSRAIDEALDGVLFIDEAYRLSEAPGGFGKEAIDTLITRMDNERDRLVVIVAGYPDKMTAFLGANPGLPRRFPRGNIITFPDYEPEDLYTILLGMLKERHVEWVPELEADLRAVVAGLYRERDKTTFGNAGDMRNLAQELETNWAQRVRADITKPVTSQDLPAVYRRFL